MLKEALQIKSLTLKNRLVMPPMATYKTAGDGKVTQDILDQVYNGKAVPKSTDIKTEAEA